MVKISAIISAYYAKEFLAGRIQNLLDQDPSPEVIVVVQEWSAEHTIAERFNVTIAKTIDVPTIYAAWNIGVRLAQGRYITNANSDDRLYTGALKVLSDALDANPGVALCYADADITQSIDADPLNRYEWAEGDFERLLESCFIGPMPMWRKSLHEKYGYFDDEMHSAGDYEFWLRIMSRGERALHIPRAIGAYLARKDGAERREPLRTLWETARARSRYAVNL